jgi:hypothetical protein
MRRRVLIPLALVLAVMLLPTGTALAQMQPVCYGNAFRQDDMAGVYVSQEATMRVEIYRCGGSMVVWDNLYGRHAAAYAGRTRLPGGGIGAFGMSPDPLVGYLDGALTIGYKPAEPGFIQVVTVNPYGGIVGIYQLQKIA